MSASEEMKDVTERERERERERKREKEREREKESKRKCVLNLRENLMRLDAFKCPAAVLF